MFLLWVHQYIISMSLINNNKLLHFITIGCLLGDASLQTFNGKTWRLRFLQSDSHKDYLFHLYDLYKPFVHSPPKLGQDLQGNKRWYFNTITFPELNYYANLFYFKKGSKFIKKVPLDILNPQNFNDSSLAYWFMDDGSLKSNKKAYILCTDSFSLNELKILQSLLKLRYNIHCSFHKQRDNYSIYIPVKHYFDFYSILEPHIVPIFRYKLGNPNHLKYKYI